MKRIIKIIILLTALLLLNIITSKVYGASSYVSASKSSVNVGDTFTVSVAGNAASWNVKLSYSGPVTLVSGSTSNANATESGNNEDATFITATFKSTGEGTATFSASGQLVDSDYSSSSAGGSKTVTITVPAPVVDDPVVNDKPAKQPGTTTNRPITTTPKKEEVKKSSNNTLSELIVAEGEITPIFEKDVREYALTIPYEITEVNVTATPSDEKATVAIEGNKDLKEGENTVTIKVTAEDGTVANYIIKVTRKRVPIALKSLIIKYQNKEGQTIELPLNPTFNFDTLEYTLQDLEYWVEKLSIEAIANIEGATIEIKGAENLHVGENTITITLKIAEQITPEGEEPKEETITYTIKVNKLEEPTLFAKIQEWFKGLMGTVGTWFNNNQPKIILGALALCIVALIGLSIYIVVDYRKYKDVIAKVKKVTEINTNSNIAEEVEQNSKNIEEINQEENKEDRPKGGKHF